MNHQPNPTVLAWLPQAMYKCTKPHKCVRFSPVIETHFLPYSLAISHDVEDTNVFIPPLPTGEALTDPESH